MPVISNVKNLQRKCLLAELKIQKARHRGERLKNKNFLLKEKNLRKEDEILTLQKEKMELELALIKNNHFYIESTATTEE